METFSIRKVKVTIDDLDEFLQKINGIAARAGTHIIIFDAGRMAGIAHAMSALRHAFRARDNGTMISARVEMEALLYAAGSRQIVEGTRFGVTRVRTRHTSASARRTMRHGGNLHPFFLLPMTKTGRPLLRRRQTFSVRSSPSPHVSSKSAGSGVCRILCWRGLHSSRYTGKRVTPAGGMGVPILLFHYLPCFPALILPDSGPQDNTMGSGIVHRSIFYRVHGVSMEREKRDRKKDSGNHRGMIRNWRYRTLVKSMISPFCMRHEVA